MKKKRNYAGTNEPHECYELTAYHYDRSGDGDTEWHTEGPFESIDEARKAWNGLRPDGYYQDAAVYVGVYDPGKFGVRPPHFATDLDAGPVASTWGDGEPL